jgi:signal transduction histidine kinase/ligand-binding sensor domain-containing protein/DNA-binding response OmpR family regulator
MNSLKFKISRNATQTNFKLGLVIIIILLLFQHSLFSQKDQIIFEHYSIDDGTSASIARSIFQDRTGFIWFGTSSGLDRYDGVNFKSYKNIPGDTLSITNGFVQCILEDNDENLWIGTTNGLDKFNRLKETFIHFKFNSISNDENINNITSIKEDNDGTFWIGTEGGLIKFNPLNGIMKYYFHDNLNSTSLNHNQIFVIHLDMNNNLWIGTNCGLDKFERETESFLRYWKDPIFKPGFYRAGMNEKYCITSIYEDNNGILWIGTNGGLLEFNPQSNKFIHYESNIQNENTLSLGQVTSICEENENEIWIGTWVGLNLFDKRTRKFEKFFHNDKIITSLSHSNISAILRERSGTLWITTFGGGINKVNRTTYPFKQYFIHSWRETERFSSAALMHIFERFDNTLWISTPNGLMKFDPQQEKFTDYILNRNIRLAREDRYGNLWLALNITSGRGLEKVDKEGRISVITDSSGNKLDFLVNKLIEGDDNIIWVCTEDEGGLIKIDSRSNKFSIVYKFPTIIYSLHRDKNGLIWFGTREKGLYCFDPKQNRVIEHYQSDTRNLKSISGNSVFAIHEDNEGNLWLGTNIGLNKFDRKLKEFYHFTESRGLAHNWIHLIFEDSKNNLWVSTLKGISKFDIKEKKFKNYDVLYGLISADRAGVGCQTKNGEIYLDSPGGLTRFHPDSIKDNPYIPPIIITGITVDSKPVFFTDSLELPYNSEQLNFEFAALSYVRPQKNLYAYKLENFDEDWINSGNRHNAIYTNLKPGKYVLRVKGSNNDGLWNEEGASIFIIIYPPWWQTAWAYLLYTFILFSIIISSTKFYLNRQRLKQKLAMELEHAEKLEEISKMKSNFFANISHEFRTPLTLIKGPAEKIISKTSDTSIKNDAALIKRNSDRLLQLINQLLDLSKFDAGKLKLEAALGNIVSFVKGVALSFESLSESKDILLKIKSEKEFIEMYFDKDKMMKILSNLLSNAFKFTPNGGQVSISITEEQNKFVVIRIKDSGIGIPDDELPKLFDRFYQVDSSHTKEFGGTGIGLAIVKEMIDLHHGSIDVKSKAGNKEKTNTNLSEEQSGWTEITISLPLGRAHLKDEEILQEKGLLTETKNLMNNDEIENKRELILADSSWQIPHNDNVINENKTIILVVEDNYDMREYIKESLCDIYSIKEAVNGEQGLRLAETIIPDLIISDLMMPKMDGNALTKRLKSDLKTSHIPVIVLTAKSGQNNLLETLTTGADEYLTKPFDIKELKLRIANLLNLRTSIQEKIKRGEISHLKRENKLSLIDQQFINKVNQVIEKHFSDENFSIEEFGKELGLSRSQFHRKLKALVGKSASLYLRSFRLNKAKLMLENGHGNIGEISYETGFSSPSYFTYCFKEEFGFPPRDL